MSVASHDPNDSTTRFERGFIAMSYVLGRRGAELGEGLAHAGKSSRALAAALSAEGRDQRARALAAELLRITSALESWRRL
jgi:hypothetical protein